MLKTKVHQYYDFTTNVLTVPGNEEARLAVYKVARKYLGKPITVSAEITGTISNLKIRKYLENHRVLARRLVPGLSENDGELSFPPVLSTTLDNVANEAYDVYIKAGFPDNQAVLYAAWAYLNLVVETVATLKRSDDSARIAMRTTLFHPRSTMTFLLVDLELADDDNSIGQKKSSWNSVTKVIKNSILETKKEEVSALRVKLQALATKHGLFFPEGVDNLTFNFILLFVIGAALNPDPLSISVDKNKEDADSNNDSNPLKQASHPLNSVGQKIGALLYAMSFYNFQKFLNENRGTLFPNAPESKNKRWLPSDEVVSSAVAAHQYLTKNPQEGHAFRLFTRLDREKIAVHDVNEDSYLETVTLGVRSLALFEGLVFTRSFFATLNGGQPRKHALIAICDVYKHLGENLGMMQDVRLPSFVTHVEGSLPSLSGVVRPHPKKGSCVKMKKATPFDSQVYFNPLAMGLISQFWKASTTKKATETLETPEEREKLEAAKHKARRIKDASEELFPFRQEANAITVLPEKEVNTLVRFAHAHVGVLVCNFLTTTLGYERVALDAQFDFRGRWYTQTAMSFTDSRLSRGFFGSSKPVKLCDAQVMVLANTLSNMLDLSQADTVLEVANELIQNFFKKPEGEEKLIEAMSELPITERPYAFILCATIDQYLKNPEFKTNTVFSWDCKSSGVQFMGMGLWDEQLAKLTSVISTKPGEERQCSSYLELFGRGEKGPDLYSVVADEFYAKTNLRLNRSMVKKFIIPIVYGSGAFGLRDEGAKKCMSQLLEKKSKEETKAIVDHIAAMGQKFFQHNSSSNLQGNYERIKSELKALDRVEDPLNFKVVEAKMNLEKKLKILNAKKRAASANTLAFVFFDFFKKSYPAISLFFEMIKHLGKHNGKDGITWETPDGVEHTLITYKLGYSRPTGPATRVNGRVTRMTTAIRNRLLDKHGRPIMNVVKMRSALAPCYVHSFDAYALRLLMNKLQARGVYPVAVHDGYYVSAADAEIFLSIAPAIYASAGVDFGNRLAEYYRRSLATLEEPSNPEVKKTKSPKKKNPRVSQKAVERKQARLLTKQLLYASILPEEKALNNTLAETAPEDF